MSVIPFEVISLVQGVNITPFVSPWSTMDKIQSKSWDLGKSVMRSIAICEKGRVEVGGPIGCNGGWDGFRLILFC
jgi:hypothetical protein